MRCCSSNRCMKRLILTIVLFVLMSSVWFQLNTKESWHLWWETCWLDDSCVSYGENETDLFLNLSSDEPPSSTRSILLLEGYSKTTLSHRMLCTIESAAMVHPKVRIFVMMTSNQLRLTRVTKKVRSKYKNVGFVHLNVQKLLMNSLVEDWFLQQRWKTSKWPNSHFTDVLRWMLLWKYGGIYLDMDVIVLRDLLQEEKNFSCLESEKWVGAGALGFTKEHPVIADALRRINLFFDGNVWGANGPELLTNVLIDRCGMELPWGNMSRCADIRIYPPKAFYPIPWWEWSKYIQINEEFADSLVHDNDILGLHVWNFHLRNKRVMLLEPTPYAVAAKLFCPTVVSEIKDNL